MKELTTPGTAHDTFKAPTGAPHGIAMRPPPEATRNVNVELSKVALPRFAASTLTTEPITESFDGQTKETESRVAL
jgi:hypothetical protein